MGPYIPRRSPRASLICEEMHDSVDPGATTTPGSTSLDLAAQLSWQSPWRSLWYPCQKQGYRAIKLGVDFSLAQLNEALRPWKSTIRSPAVPHGQMTAKPAQALQLTTLKRMDTRQLGADHARCVGGRAVACSFVAHHQAGSGRAGVLSHRGPPNLVRLCLRWHVLSS